MAWEGETVCFPETLEEVILFGFSLNEVQKKNQFSQDNSPCILLLSTHSFPGFHKYKGEKKVIPFLTSNLHLN